MRTRWRSTRGRRGPRSNHLHHLIQDASGHTLHDPSTAGDSRWSSPTPARRLSSQSNVRDSRPSDYRESTIICSRNHNEFDGIVSFHRIDLLADVEAPPVRSREDRFVPSRSILARENITSTNQQYTRCRNESFNPCDVARFQGIHHEDSVCLQVHAVHQLVVPGVVANQLQVHGSDENVLLFEVVTEETR